MYDKVTKEVKYIIVGQGLAGTLLSWQLLKRNIEHVVIDSNKMKSAGLIAAGMFNPLVFKRITKSWLADQLIHEMLKTYSKLEKLLKKQFVYHIPIAKLIYEEEKVWWKERLDSQQLQQYFGGFYKENSIEGIKDDFQFVKIEQSGYINTALMLGAYQDELIKRESLIITEMDYNEIAIGEEHINWRNIKAEKLIFCEGAYAEKNPFFKNVIFHLTKGDILEVEIMGLSEDYILNKDIFILPKGNNVFLIGSTYIHDKINWTPNPKSAEILISKAQRLIKPKIKVLKHVAGVRPTIKDRRPVIGIHPDHKQLAIFNGLGTKGGMLAPWFSKEIVELLEGIIPKVNPEVSLNRFL